MAAITANVPMIATGTATSGINADRQFCKNKSTTSATKITASRSVSKTSLHRLPDERRRVVDDGVVKARGEPRLELFDLVLDALGGLECIGAGALINRQGDRRMAVQGAVLVVLAAPSSTVATSRSRTMLSVSSVFKIMSANCFSSTSGRVC